jgi:hypothetical protein
VAVRMIGHQPRFKYVVGAAIGPPEMIQIALANVTVVRIGGLSLFAGSGLAK